MSKVYSYDPEFLPIAQILLDMNFENLELKRAGMLKQSLQLNAAIVTNDLDISDQTVESKDKGHQIPIRVYSPQNITSIASGLLYVHGGGFVTGSLETAHKQCVDIARELQVTVISVGYRLAPETPYPGPLDDCFQVFEWAVSHSQKLMIDKNRFGVMGDSAGANLVAALTLLLRDNEYAVQPCFQFLGVPVLDDNLATQSMLNFDDTPLLNYKNMATAWDFYLGDLKRGASDIPFYAAPSREVSFEGLPPTYISVMEFDPLRDEGLAYAQRLLTAGISTEIHCYPGTFHGSSLFYPSAKISQRESIDTISVLKRGLQLD